MPKKRNEYKEIENNIFSDLPNNLKFKIKQAKLEKIQKYCNEVVTAYLDLKDEDENNLWIKSKEKINLKRNAVWAVKFQVADKDFSEIAGDENLVHTTVSREVKKFLELIGLEKREAKRGRREGSKNSILARLGR